VIRQRLSIEETSYIHNVIHALNRRKDAQNLSARTVYERWERGYGSAQTTQDQMYLIGLEMKVISEKYYNDNTGGKWVVINPYYSPRSIDDVLYNQRGLTGESYRDIHKKQVGSYWRGRDVEQQAVRGQQLPPAQPSTGDEQPQYYSGRDIKSQQSLKNNRREDTYIRQSRIKSAQEDEPRRRQARAKVEEEVSYLMQCLEEAQEPWKKDRIKKRLHEIRNQLISEEAMVQEGHKQSVEYGQQLNAVDRSAQALSKMMNPTGYDEEVRANASYNRHLSLLESAKNILGNGQSKFLKG